MTGSGPLDDYYRAMRRGEEAAAELFALFTEDAVYDEPFTGLPPASGRIAIRDRFAVLWSDPLPEVELDVLSMEIDGSMAETTWECRSPGLPGPVRGRDRYQLRGDRIARLEITLLDGESRA